MLFVSERKMEDYSYLFKIILIGDANVGKTCLVKRFTKGFFTPSQGPTIGVDFTIRTVEVDGERVKVRWWNKRTCWTFWLQHVAHISSSAGFNVKVIFLCSQKFGKCQIREWFLLCSFLSMKLTVEFFLRSPFGNQVFFVFRESRIFVFKLTV